ncbi:unnamed protein product [Symbiodinium natans]|uniref:Endonuclease/exonuclease/phosphatase domain-containing protein n=1 Tax=Symbiodinium natans TaxID=878477 RepID=A0A812HI57_9DINO|nr:unnamed protein product [Symbiodinium natans]
MSSKREWQASYLERLGRISEKVKAFAQAYRPDAILIQENADAKKNEFGYEALPAMLAPLQEQGYMILQEGEFLTAVLDRSGSSFTLELPELRRMQGKVHAVRNPSLNVVILNVHLTFDQHGTENSRKTRRDLEVLCERYNEKFPGTSIILAGDTNRVPQLDRLDGAAEAIEQLIDGLGTLYMPPGPTNVRYDSKTESSEFTYADFETVRWRQENEVARFCANAPGPAANELSEAQFSELCVDGVECFPALRLTNCRDSEGAWFWYGLTAAFGVDREGRPIHLQKAGYASQRFAAMYAFAGDNAGHKLVYDGYVRMQERLLGPAPGDWRHDFQAFRRVARELARRRHAALLSRMLALIRRDGRLTLGVQEYNLAVGACARAGQWQLALHLHRSLSDAQLAADRVTYNATIGSCRKEGQWQWGLHLFHSMAKVDIAPNVITCNSAMSVCDRQGQWQLAVHFFQLFPQLGLVPDIISFTAAISSCEKAGQWQRALQMFGGICHAQLTPDMISCNAVITSSAKSGQWQLALHLFSCMPQYRLSPDTISCNATISSCEKGEQWHAAMRLFGSMPQWRLSPDVEAYTDTMTACQKSTLWQLALVLFDNMSQALILPDLICYNATMNCCARGAQWQLALHLFEAMTSHENPRGV